MFSPRNLRNQRLPSELCSRSEFKKRKKRGRQISRSLRFPLCLRGISCVSAEEFVYPSGFPVEESRRKDLFSTFAKLPIFQALARITWVLPLASSVFSSLCPLEVVNKCHLVIILSPGGILGFFTSECYM